MPARAGFDIGGTFTDIIVIAPDGRLLTFKILSIMAEIGVNVARRLGEALERCGERELSSLVHGTTVGSNALLEGKGAVAGLITSEGFRDSLEMRRLALAGAHDYGWERNAPLIPRRRRREVTERVMADGSVLKALDLEQVRAALAELDRLTRLFQDILDMARIDSNAITLDRQWVTPADVVDAAAAYVRHALEGRTLQVHADSDAEVHIDPRLVSAALAHLLENAAQYSPSGQPIAVTARAGQDGFEVSVTDNGPGLDPSELEHLFERFYRGRTARQSSFGTGMGLAITRGLLAAAGGRVWAENAPGGGARFAIVVPGTTRAAAVVE